MNAPFRPECDVTASAPVPGAAAEPWPAWPWLVLGVLLAIEAVWLLATPLGLTGPTAAVLAQLGVMVGTSLFLARRFRGHPRLHALCAGGAFLFAAWPALRLFNHLTMSLALPLADARLAGWDRAIGFDWLGYVQWADGHPLLLRAMSFSYGNLTGYTCLLFLLLALGRNPAQRCRELIALFLGTALFCTGVGAFFPAVAAMAYYRPSPELFTYVGPQTGSYHLAVLEALRNDPAHLFDLSNMPGLVTFPSFHTAMGVIAIYCARGTHWLFWPMLALNLVMIASTPVLGSHYGIDILAGAATALGAIALHRRFGAISSNNTCRIRPGSASSPSAAAPPT
ncbi:MAG TPA: phosphatase PAP2 family protein [Allosphingosinicella sp.]|nr:phosphatase PAP2 family protein [Allosphingosinicella sp.]